jgi:hypothetical protein
MLTGTLQPERRTSSLNHAQVTPDADGAVTFVLSPADPGLANWVDTGGLRQGLIYIRWQGLPKPVAEIDATRGVRKVEVVRLAVWKSALPRVTPAQRAAERARRLQGYRRLLKGRTAD